MNDQTFDPEANGAVLVTGASSGIGAACALRLDQAGFQVFACVRTPADGDALRVRASTRLNAILLDVTDPHTIQAATEAVAATVRPPGLAGLVNNAGIAAPGPLEYLPLSTLRRVLDVNVIGQVAVTQAFLPLIRQARGRVVFVSSLSGRVPLPLTGAYNASKFALEALADVWRMELHSSGVSVSVIQPGPVATPIWRKGIATGDEIERDIPEEGRARYAVLAKALRAWAERSSRVGAPLEWVTDAVMHALTAPHPKTRYVIGRGARLFLLTRVLPDRLRDRLFLGAMQR